MFPFLAVTVWVLAALVPSDVTLVENQQIVFDGSLELSERQWKLSQLGASIPSDWSSYRFLVLEMRASSPQRFQVRLITSKGVSPLYVHPFQNAWVRAVLPLQMFSNPPRRGSTLSAVFNNQRAGHFMFNWGPYLPLSQVQAFAIAMPQPIGKPTLEIRVLRLSMRSPGDAVLENEPLVDTFGQWIRDQWPGKANQLEELQKIWNQEEETLKPGDFDYCIFGGYRSSQAKASGFFRVEQINGVWWFVDPDGHLFFSAGADVMTPILMTPLRDRQAIFAKLPPPDLVPASAERMQPGVPFFQWNLIRRFGQAWQSPWVELTARRMRAWGLNTVGNWSDKVLLDGKKIPYTIPLHGWETRQDYFGLPDVFSEEFAQNCDVAAESQCSKRQNDPYLLGYFIGNEPPWPGREETVAEMILNGPDTATQRELKKALAGADTPENRKAFVYRAFKKYLEVVNNAIRKQDPNHLNLGIRFGGDDVPEAMLEASRSFDVCSLNIYEYVPSREQLERNYRVVRRPMLIGEFHFGVPGRGMSSGLRQVLDPKQKGVAYRYYVENVAAMPMMIGTHWFQWADEPNTGRSDGENYNIGLVDVTDQPYPEMVDALRTTHQHLCAIHAGRQSPASVPPKIH
jgi:hypothetical protein